MLRRGSRIAKGIVFALLVAIGINHVVWAFAQWPLGDLDIYLAAAERLRSGEPLYEVAEPFRTYWYAPWFASALVPLTFLPREVVNVGWSTMLLACSLGVGLALWALGSHAARLLAILVMPALIAVSAGGNVQAAIVLALMSTLHRPGGPVAVAVAASLKFTPFLFTLVYVARGEWTKAALTTVLTAALLVPAFLMGIPLGRIQGWDELAPGLLAWGLPVYLVGIGACAVLSLSGPIRFSALAAVAGAVLALPRLFLYDVTLVAVGVADGEQIVREPWASRFVNRLPALRAREPDVNSFARRATPTGAPRRESAPVPRR